jgi:hypothetical protein
LSTIYLIIYLCRCNQHQQRKKEARRLGQADERIECKLRKGCGETNTQTKLLQNYVTTFGNLPQQKQSPHILRPSTINIQPPQRKQTSTPVCASFARLRSIICCLSPTLQLNSGDLCGKFKLLFVSCCDFDDAPGDFFRVKVALQR